MGRKPLDLFENYLKKRAYHYFSSHPKTLRDACLYTLFQDSKRLRPKLLIEAYLGRAPRSKLTTTRMRDLLTLASCLEALHTFTLIHDDLPGLDNSDTRRGLPTNHKKFGEANAILAGDALQNFASHLLTHQLSQKQLSLTALKLFTTECKHVIEGQGLEFNLDLSSKVLTQKQMRHQFILKTGSLFGLALGFAAALQNPKRHDSIHKMVRLGYLIGLAYQIKDDLEDPVSDDPPSHHIDYHNTREFWSRELTRILKKIRRHSGIGSSPSTLEMFSL